MTSNKAERGAAYAEWMSGLQSITLPECSAAYLRSLVCPLTRMRTHHEYIAFPLETVRARHCVRRLETKFDKAITMSRSAAEQINTVAATQTRTHR